MARRKRTPAENAAIYQRRKARAAAERTTVFKRRNAEAKRLGYDGLADQRRRRKSADLTHADHAHQAKRAGGKYVDNVGGGRWTFATKNRDPAGLTPLDRARLQATMDRAWRAAVNVTITATWRKDSRTGTAQAGGSYGVRVRRIHNEGADALDSIENELQNSTDSEMPAGAHITSLSLFFFPAISRAA